MKLNSFQLNNISWILLNFFTVHLNMHSVPFLFFVCLFVCLWVYRPTREFFNHMETSPLSVQKGCKFLPMLGTHGRCVWWCTKFKSFKIHVALRCVIMCPTHVPAMAADLNLSCLEFFVNTSRLNLYTILYMYLQFSFRSGTDWRGFRVWRRSIQLRGISSRCGSSFSTLGVASSS